MSRLEAFRGKTPFFADLHNHCNISYAHGSLEEALNNGRQRLDICSVTGHAHWPDMPARDGKINHIIDFHEEGFRKLREGWKADVDLMRSFDRDTRFLVFPGFEIHSMEAGDYTIISKGFDMELLYPSSIEDFRHRLEEAPALREQLIAFPHHIGYKNGRRGINWEQFDDELFPLVEIYSMHGCAEEDENDHPFLHTMGPGSSYGTIRHGLGPAGKRFGILGNTDHHSAHPGSYGHGISGVWADGLDHDSVWEALHSRRTYAMTADKMELEFSVNGAPMGAVTSGRDRRIDFSLRAGGALDYLDIIRNGELLSRFSQTDFSVARASAATAASAVAARVSTPAGADDVGSGGEPLRTIIYVETGWGERGKAFDWDVQLGLERGRLLRVDARFRGDEVVSPLDATGEQTSFFRSSWEYIDERTVSFRSRTTGNPTNSTPATQGLAMEVEVPTEADLHLSVNGKTYRVPIERLMSESFIDYTGGFDSPAFKLHRAPSEREYVWSGSIEDPFDAPAYYYLRGRQKNGARVWSSPVWVE
jgi:hypothetical protein